MIVDTVSVAGGKGHHGPPAGDRSPSVDQMG